jgi:hypothetical protein
MTFVTEEASPGVDECLPTASTMTSPVAYLHRHVLITLGTIAPEREQEYRAEFNRLNIKFLLDPNEQGIRFAAAQESKQILVGTACLERLWAIAFAYYRFYRELAAQRLADQANRIIELRRTPELCEAGDLLKWAVEADLLSKAEQAPPTWPAHLPRPRPDAPHASDEHCATEMFLAAVAYILHHEFAHLRKDHQTYGELESVDAIRQEKEADFEAAEWILGALPDEHDPMFQKRALGVGLGLVWIASLYVYAGQKAESSTHPPAYDRLFQVMERYVHDPNNLPWAFVQTVLALHLQNQNVPHDIDREFSSFKEAVDYSVDVISKMHC